MKRVVLVLLLVSCGKPQPPAPSPSPSPAAMPMAGKGTVRGRVRVDGDDIAPLKVRVTGYESFCHPELDPGLYRVDPATHGLADAFVSIDGGDEDFRVAGPQVLDQKACLFSPPVMVASPGEIIFKNSDAMAHNTTIAGRLNPSVNINLAAGSSTSARFAFSEKLTVRCSIHPWMFSALIVTRSKTHALSDAAGRFEITGVPAGRRTVQVWHLMGELHMVEVDVPAGGTVEADISWKPKAGFRDSR